MSGHSDEAESYADQFDDFILRNALNISKNNKVNNGQYMSSLSTMTSYTNNCFDPDKGDSLSNLTNIRNSQKSQLVGIHSRFMNGTNRQFAAVRLPISQDPSLMSSNFTAISRYTDYQQDYINSDSSDDKYRHYKSQKQTFKNPVNTINPYRYSNWSDFSSSN